MVQIDGFSAFSITISGSSVKQAGGGEETPLVTRTSNFFDPP